MSITPQQQSIANQISPQHGTLPAGPQVGRPTNLFPDEGKVRELALHIHSCLVQAQQLKLAANAQQQPQPAANQQVRDSFCPSQQHLIFTDITSGRNVKATDGSRSLLAGSHSG